MIAILSALYDDKYHIYIPTSSHWQLAWADSIFCFFHSTFSSHRFDAIVNGIPFVKREKKMYFLCILKFQHQFMVFLVYGNLIEFGLREKVWFVIMMVWNSHAANKKPIHWNLISNLSICTVHFIKKISPMSLSIPWQRWIKKSKKSIWKRFPNGFFILNANVFDCCKKKSFHNVNYSFSYSWVDQKRSTISEYMKEYTLL